jgi:hypothetical protein
LDRTSFILDESCPLDGDVDRAFGSLEYRRELKDGRVVLLSFYQLAAQQTLTAEMWIPEDVRRMLPDASIGSVARHRQVWSYGPNPEVEGLVRAIVAEVATWLQSSDPASESEGERPYGDA